MGFAPGDRPRLRAGLASLRLDGVLLLGADDLGRLASFDPVSAVLVDALDGRATVAEVAEDLAAATGTDTAAALDLVERLLESLAHDGFLDGHRPLGGLPRRVAAEVTADSCLGIRMGLGRAEMARVEDPLGFRFGATLPTETARLAEALRDDGHEVGEDRPVGELVVLRASSGRVPRLQQVFASLGRRWFARRDLDSAREAFHRSVVGRARARRDGTWLEGVSLSVEGGVVLVQPGLEDTVLGDRRAAWEDLGVVQTPSGVLGLQQGRVVLPPDPVDGRPSASRPVLGAVVPYPVDRIEAIRQLAHLLFRWDDRSLAALADLLGSVPVLAASDDGGIDTLGRRLARLAGR